MIKDDKLFINDGRGIVTVLGLVAGLVPLCLVVSPGPGPHYTQSLSLKEIYMMIISSSLLCPTQFYLYIMMCLFKTY